MSERATRIHDEAMHRTDIYPILGDLQDYGKPNTSDRITLKKILNDEEEYNLSKIKTVPTFKYIHSEEEFKYTSDQFSGKWPLQIKLDAAPGFYPIEDYNLDRFFGMDDSEGEGEEPSHTENGEEEEEEEETPKKSKSKKKEGSNHKFVSRVTSSTLYENIKNPSKIPLRVLDVEKDILDDFTVTLMGRRRSGKSFESRWLLYHLRHRFPCGCVITGTKLNSFWSQYIPDEFVHELKDMELVIDRVFTRQRTILEHPELGIDPRFFLILDDVLSDKYWIQHSVCLSKCFTDGRHFKIFTLITTQDPRGIPPTLRENTDLAIIFRQYQEGRKKAVCEDFIDYIENKSVAKKFLWDKTKSLDEEGNVLEIAVGDEDEIPVALSINQAKTTNNMQEIFKLAIAHDPGDFVMGDIDYWKAQFTGNWLAVMNTDEIFERRFKTFKPRYKYGGKGKAKQVT